MLTTMVHDSCSLAFNLSTQLLDSTCEFSTRKGFNVLSHDRHVTSNQSILVIYKALSYLVINHHAYSCSKRRDQNDGTRLGSEKICFRPTIRSLALKDSSTFWLEQLDWMDDVHMPLKSISNSLLIPTYVSSRFLRSTALSCSLEINRRSTSIVLICLMFSR